MDGVELRQCIQGIANTVEKDRDRALIHYTKKFDGVELEQKDIEVEKGEWEEKTLSIDPELRAILKKAAENIRNYALKQNIYKDYELDNNGIQIKDRFIPVESVGVYVPGGEYPYPSTVLMCAIPARVAGVKKIYMVTPSGNITPAVLEAARIAGVDRIFQVGGAQAIAALAIGTETVPKVDMIVGPGNKYVQQAKLYFSNRVGIDMIAGPSEVVIIADEFQNPGWIATDMMAQAEHAPDAASCLITYSDKLIEKVGELISDEFSDRVKKIRVQDLNEAVEKANLLAPEHLQLMLTDENISEVEGKIRNAGAVFLGSNTPVAVGDYWAGPSHTLPTGSSARFYEGLNVRTFLKKVSFIRCSDENIKETAPFIEKFAKEEGMKYHAESVIKRIEKK